MPNLIKATTIALVAITICTQQSLAISKFKTPFFEKYAAKHENKEFQAAVKKASCNTCHVKGEKKSRKALNAYATQLEKLIEGDANARVKAATKTSPEEGEKEVDKVLAELDKAFDKVADMKSADGPKYGELLKEGKLPVDIEKAIANFKERKAKEEAEKKSE